MHERANRIASESGFRRLAVEADTTGRGGRYDRLQGPIQQAAEADTASRSFNISSNVKFQMVNFKSECQMKRTMTIRESVFSHYSRLYRQILFASPPTLRACAPPLRPPYIGGQ